MIPFAALNRTTTHHSQSTSIAGASSGLTATVASTTAAAPAAPLRKADLPTASSVDPSARIMLMLTFLDLKTSTTHTHTRVTQRGSSQQPGYVYNTAVTRKHERQQQQSCRVHTARIREQLSTAVHLRGSRSSFCDLKFSYLLIDAAAAVTALLLLLLLC